MGCCGQTEELKFGKVATSEKSNEFGPLKYQYS